MHQRLQKTRTVTVISMILAPLIAAFLGSDPAIVVLVEIIAIDIFVVVFVMVIGSLEKENHPATANEAPSVIAWRKRLNANVEAKEIGKTLIK